MTRILVIDDLRSFTDEALSSAEFKNAEITYARTSDEGMQELKGHDDHYFDVIYFDHDLGGEDTTKPVALYLEEKAYFGAPYDAKIVIHSSNSAGVNWLAQSLRHYDVKIIDARECFHSMMEDHIRVTKIDDEGIHLELV